MSVLFQKQVRDNSQDLQAFMKELNSWEDEMKRKEASRVNNRENEDLPPVRSKMVRKMDKSEEETSKTNRISSYDYSSWEKFDVEAACKQIDEEHDKSEKETKPSDRDVIQCKDKAYAEKEKGNRFVKEQKWTQAAKCYTEAIKEYDKDPIFHANRALCYLKLQNYVNAEIDCTNALQLDPTYVKALQRRAAARIQLNQLNEAHRDLSKVMELEPNNKESLTELNKLKKRLNITSRSSTTVNVNIPASAKIDPVSQKQTTNVLEIESSINKDEIIKKNDEISLESKDAVVKDWKESRTSEKSKLREQIWNDSKDYVLIKPIEKPPHLRSKKPLKRINVEEIEYKVDYKEKSQNSNNPHLDMNKQQNITQTSSTVFVDVDILPIPKTCLQFISHWKSFGSDYETKFKYLLKIPFIELPNIFQEFLESDLFCDILLTLNKNYCNENSQQILNYLSTLPNVKRFPTLILFLSKKEKHYVNEIIENIRKMGTFDEILLDSLRKSFEV